MTDYDVTLTFSLFDTDREKAGQYVDDVMEAIVNDTGLSVAANIVESQPDPDGSAPTETSDDAD